MKTVGVVLLFFCFFGGLLCYCPPLYAPNTTQLTCEEPEKSQRVNCSTSWLPEGTVAYFSCLTDSQKRAKGRIICSENGVHRHITNPKLGNISSFYLPCGIRRNSEQPDIHVYGFQAPIHYDLTVKAGPDYQILGETLHNEFRTNHDAPPLQLQANLSKLAQDWADKISITGKLDMAPNLSFGQNMFLAQTTNLTAAVNDAVQNWYYEGRSEYCWADVTENWSNSLALDFSQTVWKSSKYLGIGAAALKSGKGTAVIAFYDPSGNIVIDGDEESSERFFELNVLSLQVNDTSVKL